MLETVPFDLKSVREDFPILARKIRGKRLVYLDNGATTQKPRQVIDALVDYYSRYNSNVHRSAHTLGEEATAAYEGARERVAGFVGCPPGQLVFTRGTTESINLVRFAWGQKNLTAGDTVVTTLMEHHSNIVPWQQLTREKGATLRFVGLTEDGRLDLSDFEEAMRQSPALVAFTQCSNVLGTLNDVPLLTKKAKEAGAVTLVDAAQSVPHMPVDFSRYGCDFFAFSGHKMLGPTGIGALCGSRELLEEMEPFHGGGEMIKEVFLDHATWNQVPHKFEAGTVNIADAIGLGAAVDYLKRLGMESVRGHELALTKYALDRMNRIPKMTIYGPRRAEDRGGVVSFNLGDIHPHDLATILDEDGVAIRSGHHCAQPLMRWLNVAATTRASFYIYNGEDDVDALCAGLERAGSLFRL